MISESERPALEAFLAMKMREEIANGNITINKNNIGFVISHKGEEIEYSDESNEIFFDNLLLAAQKFGRVEPTKQQKEE